MCGDWVEEFMGENSSLKSTSNQLFLLPSERERKSGVRSHGWLVQIEIKSLVEFEIPVAVINITESECTTTRRQIFTGKVSGKVSGKPNNLNNASHNILYESPKRYQK